MVIGMGSEKNAKRQYGAILNDFSDGYQERFIESGKVAYIYVFDSSQIEEQGTIVNYV